MGIRLLAASVTALFCALSQYALSQSKEGVLPGHVPPPYTAMKASGLHVEVIGRAIDISDTGLPAQLISAGGELLAEPIKIVGQIDDKFAEIQATTPFHFTQTAADDSMGEAAVGFGPLTGTLSQTMSFDGFCWYEIRLNGQCNAKDVRIEIPLKSSAAEYYQLTDTDYKTLGIAEYEIADVLRKDLTLPFTHQVYLGNDKMGLAWMAESQKGWQIADDRKAIEVRRTENGVLLRINLVDAPIDLTDGLRFAFGLQPTPVKPVTPRQQKFIFAPGRSREFPADAEVFEVYQGHRAEDPATFASYAGLPEPSNPELLKKAVARSEALGSHLTPYSEFTWLSLGLPEMQTFGGDWYLNEPWAGTANSAANPEPFGLCDIENQDYQDFIVWRFIQSWQAYGGSSVYIDLFSPTQDKLPEHHRAYTTRSGRVAYPMAIRAARTIARRLYIAYKQRNPNFAMFTHASNMYTAMVAFGDAWPVGEHFTLAASRYPEVLTYNRYRAWFYGYPVGLKTMFLPSMKTPTLKAQIPLSNYLVGIVFNHNTTFWMCFCNPWIVMPYLRTFHAGDWNQLEYLPYWQYPHLTNLDPEQFKVSGWFNSDKRQGLLVIASMSDQPVKTTITLGRDWPYPDAAGLSDAVRNTIGFYEFGTWDPQVYFDGKSASFQPYGVLMSDVK